MSTSYKLSVIKCKSFTLQSNQHSDNFVMFKAVTAMQLLLMRSSKVFTFCGKVCCRQEISQIPIQSSFHGM